MARIDFQKTRIRDQRRRYGFESISPAEIPAEFRGVPKPKTSKAQLREELEALMASHDIKKVKLDTRGRIEPRKPHQQK